MKGEKVLCSCRSCSNCSNCIVSFLQRYALKCPKGMEIVSLTERNEVIEVDFDNLIERFEGIDVYNCYKRAIGVLYQNEYYALPETKTYINKLQAFGIMKKDFFIYLHEDQYPKDEFFMQMWDDILQKGIEQKRLEFKEECMKWATAYGIMPIPDSELENSLKIPANGFRVRIGDDDYDQEETYNPIVSYTNPSNIEYVGTYSTYGNRVIFVATDGDTYLSKGNHIINVLRRLKFRELNNYPTPISFIEDEGIVDEKLKFLWHGIHEIND